MRHLMKTGSKFEAAAKAALKSSRVVLADELSHRLEAFCAKSEGAYDETTMTVRQAMWVNDCRSAIRKIDGALKLLPHRK